MAVTDHDTLGGIAEARAAAGSRLEVIAGVEITSEFAGRELHLLGYFFRPDDAALAAGLERLRRHRVGRFREMVERLRACGVSLHEEELQEVLGSASLGRRHLAELLVKSRRAGSVREVFVRYLHDGGRAEVPKYRLPVGEAIGLVRGAGGIAGWAHPSAACTRESLARLRGEGLQALEVEFPSCRPSRNRELRAWAAALGLAVTGGSDCHGPENYRQAVGARSVTQEELGALRRLVSP
jgi:predicted metal-dependent phosphoesterase TrpH